MKPGCDEMSWEEVAAKLDGANNILAQDFNRLTKEYSRLLIQITDSESVQEEYKNRNSLKSTED
ncbi:MAG: hypothetical protein H8E32_11900 [Nitrospinae bacterium]|nr:hypothetical protein [Nitrospinota bacterium]